MEIESKRREDTIGEKGREGLKGSWSKRQSGGARYLEKEAERSEGVGERGRDGEIELEKEAGIGGGGGGRGCR